MGTWTRDEQVMIDALHSLAAWGDGPVVNSIFDSPGTATAARAALAGVGIFGPPEATVNPLDQFKSTRSDDLDMLRAHFASKQAPVGSNVAYSSIDALLADMLDDVIDIWLEAHLGSLDEGCDTA